MQPKTRSTRLSSSARRGHSINARPVARAALVNGVFGVADYLTQPVAMLIAAPMLIRSLGVSQYGIWMIANAIVGTGNILAAGLGDAAVKHVSDCRGQGDWHRMKQVIGCVMMINLVLGSAVACMVWTMAPYATHILKVDAAMDRAAVQVLRIGAAILIVRSVESILVGVLRAFENYRAAVQITSVTRLVTIAAATLLAAHYHNITSIMAATLCVALVGVALLAFAVRATLGPGVLLPAWNRQSARAVVSFGCLSWIQGLSGAIFNQVDRLIIGVLLGPVELGYYSVCTQATQPIHGLAASGLHFLLPHVSARKATSATSDYRRVLVTAFWCNAAIAVLVAAPLALFSRQFLTLWMGASFAAHTSSVLALLAIAWGFLALNVTLHYTLLALGQIRYVTLLNMAAGVAMLLGMALLIPRFGLLGAALGRLIYGPVTWLMYFRLRGHDDLMLQPASPAMASARAL